jgi:parvulin-like peptidyl-prolyl isomerase
MRVLSVFLISAFLYSLCPQEVIEEPLARIGNITITADEFQQRYEMTPLFRKHNKNITESLKLEFLFTLISEKLWAIDAYQQGIDRSDVIEFSEKAFEKMFVRDALYHQEIKNNVSVSEEEFIEGYLRSTQKLFVNFLFSEDETEINDLHNFLNQDFPFDTILAESPELSEQENPVEIVFGQMEEYLEDSLYNLKDGEYTYPILTEDGWYIFKLTNKIETPLLTAKERDDARNTVRKTIEARKEKELYTKYYKEFFVNKKVEANGELLKTLSVNLSEILTGRKNNLNIKDDEAVHLTSGDFLTLKENTEGNILSSSLINFDVDPVTVKDFINHIAFEGFSAMETNAEQVFVLLNTRVRKFIEEELLAREGYRKGLNKLPEVQSQLAMWRENYLFQLMQSKYLDSVKVSEEEVLQYYNARHKENEYPVLVNIIEVLTESLSTMEMIVKEIEQGKDIRQLALEYTKRDWVKEKNGEFGLFPVYMHGEIGRAAETMEVGEIYGPLKVPEGYSVFKLIDKQEEKVLPPEPFEKFKDNYIEKLGYDKVKVMITNHTADLAVKYGVSINEDILKAIQVTSISAFGFRYLGFGGRITASPLIAPNTDWVEKWIEKIDIIQ